MAPNPSKDPQRVAAGLKSAELRWGSATQAEKDASAAHMRAGILPKYRAEAQATFDAMGIEPTPEQLEAAAENLRVKALRENATKARKAAAEQARVEFMEWAVKLCHNTADLLHTWAPQVPDKDQFRITIMALKDELDSPDGPSRPRLRKRLQALVDHVKGQQDATTLRLAVPWDFEVNPNDPSGEAVAERTDR